MPVTRDDVMHIASLARLSIDEGRVPELVTQLNGILGHMDALQQAATQCAAAPSAVGVDRSPPRGDAGPPCRQRTVHGALDGETMDQRGSFAPQQTHQVPQQCQLAQRVEAAPLHRQGFPAQAQATQLLAIRPGR